MGFVNDLFTLVCSTIVAVALYHLIFGGDWRE
jgi:hypothetical protein